MRTHFSSAVRLAYASLVLALAANAGCSGTVSGTDASSGADAGDGSRPTIDAQVEDDGGLDAGDAFDGGDAADGCAPRSCLELGVDCDSVDDGCGGTLECGTCTAPETCGGDGTANVCGCTPRVCTAGLDCGERSDGCGGTIDCGGCTGSNSCAGAGTPNECGCTPTTCTDEGAECGQIPDGCGGTLTCGGCTSPEVCGGGGAANVCGEGPCTPTSCVAEGFDCGSISDGCDGTLSCGTCSGTDTCGGAGTANVCGCTPRSPATACAGAGLECGMVGDGCGGTIDCGGCIAPETCSANQCSCVPATPTAACGARECGTASDGCGGTVTCGTCTGIGEICTGAGACECTPRTVATACTAAGLECGTVPDGCGGTLPCGTCIAPETCSANQCSCIPATPSAACGARECGTVDDGCGTPITCGTCTGTGEICTGTGACECTPRTVATACTAAGLECGTVPDGCGGSLVCGSCAAPETCNPANLCECVPSTTCGARECGSVDDGCGTPVACGTCTGTGEVCSSTGACVCTPDDDADACADAGAECGTVTNNCGATTGSCGTCGPTELCTANTCVVAPPTITSLDLEVLAHGASITITGTQLGTATDVSIDGAMQPIVSAGATSLAFRVDDAASVGTMRALTVTTPGGTATTSVTVIHLVIDELDSDNFGAPDTTEYVELTTGIAAAVDLTGYHLVLVDGATDLTYASFPLGMTGADGRLVIGNASLTPASDLSFGDDTLEDGADAAAIVRATTAVPAGTPVTGLATVIDALVYGGTADAGLLDALLGTGPTRVQPHEAFGDGGPGNDSIQRCSAARLDGRAFSILAEAAPRVPNVCP